MHSPPHPGEFINDIYLEPNGISGRELAVNLGVAPSTLSHVLKGTSRVTPEMVLRLKAGWPCKMPMTYGMPASMLI